MASSFPQFSKLPTELRLIIWRLCLPHRVAELDCPAEEDINDELENCGGCWLIHTSRINAFPPVLTRVCRESRLVALERAGYVVDDEGIDPGLRDNTYFDISLADATSMYWARLMDTIALWLAAASWAQGASLRGQLFQHDLNYGVWDDAHDVFISHDELVHNWTFLVCLRIVVIHAPLQPAVESGLFGLLGDARITLIDATDTARKEQYRAF